MANFLVRPGNAGGVNHHRSRFGVVIRGLNIENVDAAIEGFSQPDSGALVQSRKR